MSVNEYANGLVATVRLLEQYRYLAEFENVPTDGTPVESLNALHSLLLRLGWSRDATQCGMSQRLSWCAGSGRILYSQKLFSH